MKILYFFPEKFATTEHGIYVRVITILQYFKNKGFQVDMLSIENHEILNSFVLDNDLVNSIHYTEEVKSKKKGLEFIFWKIQNQYYKIFPRPTKQEMKRLDNLVTNSLISKVEELQKSNNYDIFLITYTYWADLAKHMRLNGFTGKAIIDPTDFLTLQHYYKCNPKPKLENIGNVFGDELKKLSQFDEIIHISYDEYIIFSSFLPNIKHHYIPQFFKPNEQISKSGLQYDVLFVGSSNPYNIEAINWFLKEVYHLLGSYIKIAIAGRVCEYITEKNYGNNVTLLGFVEDADALYQKTKITICPLKRGTGMKIKVIESLSYSIPVVSTSKGVDGFLNKKPIGGVLIGNTAIEFANGITRLITDEAFFSVQKKLAGELFYADFSVEKNLEKLSQIF